MIDITYHFVWWHIPYVMLLVFLGSLMCRMAALVFITLYERSQRNRVVVDPDSPLEKTYKAMADFAQSLSDAFLKGSSK